MSGFRVRWIPGIPGRTRGIEWNKKSISTEKGLLSEMSDKKRGGKLYLPRI